MIDSILISDPKLCWPPSPCRRHEDRVLHGQGEARQVHHVPGPRRLQVREGLVQVRRSPRHHRRDWLHLHLRQIGELLRQARALFLVVLA